MTATPLISFAIPCYNEEDVLPILHRELTAFMDRYAGRYDFEVVLVDDGSRDRTWEIMERLAAEDPRFRCISFSRNFGHQFALSCAYDYAAGDAVVCMDADLQDPLEAVARMIEKWEKGYDIALGVRITREGESFMKLFLANGFYWLFGKLSRVPMRANSGDFRLLSRRALDAMMRMREQHRYIRGMVNWLGFRTAEVLYHREARKAGVTKYPTLKSFHLALDAIVSFSSLPLRLSYVLSMALTTIFLIYLAVVSLRVLLGNGVLVPGWSSLLLAITGFGMCTLFAIGIIREYVGRIYEQVKGRPLYLTMRDTARPTQRHTHDDVGHRGARQ